MIKIREAEKEDLKDIFNLASELHKHEARFYNGYEVSKKSIKALEKFLRKKFKEKNTKFFVAIDNKKVIGYSYGYIWKRYPIHKIIKIGYISDCFVLKKYRGKGIGERLTTALINWFKSKDIKKVELDVLTKNKKSVRVWRSLGFKEYMKKMEKLI